MSAWIHAISTPLGLAGFALFLIFSTFGVTARKSASKADGRKASGGKPSGIQSAGLFALAGIALFGSLFLAHEKDTVDENKLTASLHTGPVQQTVGTASEVIGVRADLAKLPASTTLSGIVQSASAASAVIGLDLSETQSNSPSSRSPAR